MGELFLNDCWTMYFHDPNDDNWEKHGYIKISDIGTIQDFWKIADSVGDNWGKGMFFLMREHIFPRWDEDMNKHGGAISVKILTTDVTDYWIRTCCKVLGETIVKGEHLADNWDIVNGMSISPKKNFCIIKLWLRSTELTEPSSFDLDPSPGDMIFKPY